MMEKLSPRQFEALELLAAGKVLIVRIKLDIRHYCYIRTGDKNQPFIQVAVQTFQSLVNRFFIMAASRDEDGNSDWVITEAGRVALANKLKELKVKIKEGQDGYL